MPVTELSQPGGRKVTNRSGIIFDNYLRNLLEQNGRFDWWHFGDYLVKFTGAKWAI